MEFHRFASHTDAGRSSRVLLVNGAEGGATAERIDDPNNRYWTYVDDQLAQAGVSGAQVQTVWLKEAIDGNSGQFPADAQALHDALRSIVHILKQRFPNLWLVYLSSRIYGGYATTDTNPEPFAYDSGFAVKWLIEDQLAGRLPVSSDTVPWLSWGPYLWANGTHPRSDGLSWQCSDFQSDGTHPSKFGTDKVANLLVRFLHTDATARIWYVRGGRSLTKQSGTSSVADGQQAANGSASDGTSTPDITCHTGATGSCAGVPAGSTGDTASGPTSRASIEALSGRGRRTGDWGAILGVAGASVTGATAAFVHRTRRASR